jgi:ubiquinone/menaquinone biosynthesis C-methylase UbiE
MILNWVERWVVNNPIRVMEQWAEIQWIKGNFPMPRGMRTLEIGCGRGAGARLIKRTFSPASLHIMDLDHLMIKKARRYLSSNEGGDIFCYVGDACHLPFRSGSMDAVFGFGFLHHVPDWCRALAEVSRVLVSGGIYFLEELYPSLYQNVITKHLMVHPAHDRFESKDLREGLCQTGMEIREAVEVKKLGILAVAVKNSSSASFVK